MTEPSIPANRLIDESSPYLQQHAYNPVDWYPWCDDAFARAMSEGKAVFLSIGYSTCHWCHVMERESFADEQVSALLNADYICIKVDREERPDIDHLYMEVCRLLTGSGGWPLNVWLTPDKIPFYAGTYFPKQKTYHKIGLLELLPQLSGKWKQDPMRVQAIGNQIMEECAKQRQSTDKNDDMEELVTTSLLGYERTFDRTYGGFGKAPKFPLPVNLMWLLRCSHRDGDEKALEMAELTLRRMVRGGMYDHVGHGFCRYSTDEKWLIPHFEKMLYDNALLVMAYTEAYQLTKKDRYREIAEQVCRFVLHELETPNGGFYCALDAETEGVEGRFYVWTKQELELILGEKDAMLYADVYQFTADATFAGGYVPNLLMFDVEQYARTNKYDVTVLNKRLEACRQRLLQARDCRTRPHRDEKILVSWNSLMIVALCKAARAFQNHEWLDVALRALDRIESEADFCERRQRLFLDDCAYLTWAYVELYETSGDATFLQRAMSRCEHTIRKYWDEQAGGFFFSAHDAERLPLRLKKWHDGALPSGNSVALYTMVKLSRMSKTHDLSNLIERLIRCGFDIHRQQPTMCAMYLLAVDLWRQPPLDIEINGTEDDEQAMGAVRYLQSLYLPTAHIVRRHDEQTFSVTICDAFQCLPPLKSLTELEKWYAQRALT